MKYNLISVIILGIGYILMLWFSIISNPEQSFIYTIVITLLWSFAFLLAPYVDTLIKLLEEDKNEEENF